EPFFTTKEQGKGTGLGLSMVFGAVKTHAGFIEVSNRSGAGACFDIYLPLLDAEALMAVPESLPSEAGQGECILVVDDEEHVRKITAKVLQLLGYRVLLAEDGVAAQALFSAHAQEIDLALLDVVMPRCGGVELAASLHEIRPKLPVIFVTGYDMAHISEAELENGCCQVLAKPVHFDRLSHMIRSMINAKPDAV
ncbi:MAG: response regulator, partial [Mariprofundus sp.]